MESSLFNSSENKEDRVLWRNLSIEERIKLLKAYFEKENFGEEIERIVLEEVENGNLKLKKELVFDEINCRIIKINAIIYNLSTKKYMYDPKILTKKEKLSKTAEKLLFRN